MSLKHVFLTFHREAMWLVEGTPPSYPLVSNMLWPQRHFLHRSRRLEGQVRSLKQQCSITR